MVIPLCYQLCWHSVDSGFCLVLQKNNSVGSVCPILIIMSSNYFIFTQAGFQPGSDLTACAVIYIWILMMLNILYWLLILENLQRTDPALQAEGKFFFSKHFASAWVKANSSQHSNHSPTSVKQRCFICLIYTIGPFNQGHSRTRQIYTHSQQESNECFHINSLFSFCSRSASCLHSLSLYTYF